MDGFYLALFILLPLSLLGFFTNWFVFRTLLKLKSFRMAFGYLSASQSLADAIHSTTFLFFFTPLVMTHLPILMKLAHILGLLIMTTYELSLYTHLAISINRVCAVWIPKSYSKVFSTQNTIAIIIVIWIVIVSSNLTFYEYLCGIIFDERSNSITFGKTETCLYVGLFGVLLKNMSFIIILIIIDIFTLIGVKKTRSSTHMSSATQDRISNREKRFLKQIIYQSFIILLELSVYFVVPQLSNDPDIFFFATTVPYVTVHVLDGDQKTMKDYSHHCGFVVVFVYELTIFSHFAISINRFCAVWIPLKYARIFNKTNTFIIIFMIWIVIGSSDVLLFEYLCHISYNELTHSFGFTPTEFCGTVGWYGDFVKNSVIVTVIMVVDIVTLIGVRHARLSANIDNESHNRITKRERRFLKQTVIQGSIFMLELLTYFFTPQVTSNIMVIFFGTSFAYVAVHVLDGIIVIWCNPEIRRFILCRKDPRKLSTSNNRS